MAAKKAPAKKVPAKKAPAKKSPAPRSANAAEKDMMDKKAKSRTDKSGNSGFGAGKKEGVRYPLSSAPNPKNRTDAQGRSGMGASYPRKSNNQKFWDSVGGKALIATNPVLGGAALISAAERAARKKIKGKKWAGDPGLKPGE